MIMWCMGTKRSAYSESSLRCIYSSQPINVCQGSVMFRNKSMSSMQGPCPGDPHTASSLWWGSSHIWRVPILSPPTWSPPFCCWQSQLQQTASLVWMVSWKNIASFPGLPILQSCNILQAIDKLNGSWEGLEMRLHKNSIAAYIVRVSATCNTLGKFCKCKWHIGVTTTVVIH